MGATKGDLMAQMLVERDKLLLAVAGLSAEDAQRTAIGEWSVKDIVAHIAAWDGEAARRLELIGAGRESEIVDYGEGEIDEWNARAVAQRRDARWDEVLAELHEARERLFEALRSLSDEQIAATDSRFPIAEWLPQWTQQHDGRHASEVLAWRKREHV